MNYHQVNKMRLSWVAALTSVTLIFAQGITGQQHGQGATQGFVQSGFGQQGFVQPGFSQQGFPHPGFSQQRFVQPGSSPQGFSQQGFAQPGFSQQGFAQPGFSQQGFAQPGFSQQGFVQPGSSQQRFVQPGSTPQGFSQQGFAQPGFSQQEFVQPGSSPQRFVQPGSSPQGFGQQGIVQPGFGQQRFVQPGFVQQRFAQPDSSQQKFGSSQQGSPTMAPSQGNTQFLPAQEGLRVGNSSQTETEAPPATCRLWCRGQKQGTFYCCDEHTDSSQQEHGSNQQGSPAMAPGQVNTQFLPDQVDLRLVNPSQTETEAPPATCRHWCRGSKQGAFYCCEEDTEPITIPIVRLGTCPPRRPVCAKRSDNAQTCSDDSKCQQTEKCCFDICLKSHICKPSII